MYSGKLGGKVAVHSQHYYNTPSFTTDWDTIMSRTINWLLEGTGGPGIIKNDVVCLATAYNNGRKLVADSSGNLYTVYVNRTSVNQIFISNTSDLGETWNENKVTNDSASTGRDQYEPSLTIDSSDRLHVVWRGDVAGYNHIRYANSADGGKTWDNFKMVTTGTSKSDSNFAPSIAVDSHDTVHIAWYGSSASNTASYNIHYINRTSTGTWGTLTMVTTDTNDLYHQNPNIAVDSENDVHVLWAGHTSSAAVYNIQYKTMDATTGTWSSINMITSSSSNDNSNASMVIDLDDNIYVVWDAEPTPKQIKLIKYDATTKAWGSVTEIATNLSHNNYSPSVGVDWRGYVYVAWYKTSPSAIMMAIYDGKYWSDGIISTPEKLNASTLYPNIIYGGKHSIAGRGTCLVFTGKIFSVCSLYFIQTLDFNLTDHGPWKGIPTLKHLYRDDNPSITEEDMYTITLRVRDDDTGIGEWTMTFEVRNVWPEIDITEFVPEPAGPESAFFTPEIKFTDPGSGPTETWKLWLDMDNSENWTAGDMFYNDTTTPDPFGNKLTYSVVMKDYHSYVTIAPLKLPYNDDYDNTIGCYIYDDDVPTSKYLINITYPLVGDGEIYMVKQNSMSGSTAYASQRNLVMSSNGTLYAVYTSYPYPYQIYCSVSEDMGKTWKEYEVTTDSASTGQYQYYTSVAIDSKDVLHVTWAGLVSGYYSYQIRYANSNDGGKTWGNFKMVTTGTSYPHYAWCPSIAVDSKDTVHIVWHGRDSTNSYSYNIRYINRTSSGTWSSVTLVTSYTGSYYNQYPSIAVDTKDNVHVTWYGRTPSYSYYQIQYRMKSGATGAWGSIRMITTASYYQYYPCIVADLNDNVHILWYGDSPYRVKYVRYNASSSSWDAIQNVASDTYNYYPTISVDQRGYIYAGWSGGTAPYQIRLSVKKSPTGSWSTPVTLSDDPSLAGGYQYYASFLGHGATCYPQTGAALVWSGYGGSSYDTYFTTTDDFWTGETFERKGFKDWMDLKVENEMPLIEAPASIYFLPNDKVEFDITLSDQGSDDLYMHVDWGDGSTNMSKKWYNNGVSPEPVYPPTPTPFNGTAPFVVPLKLSHKFPAPRTYYINLTLWDDDLMAHGENGTKWTIKAEVMKPKILKETTVKILEGLLPGRMGYLGYDTLTLRYLNEEMASYILVYNDINRPPFYQETKLLATFCDVEYNDIIMIDGTLLAEGMFGTSLILKAYNESYVLLDETEISTIYTCLEPLEVNQTYGPYLVEGFTKVKGLSYHFYSKYATKLEDALDHILRSLNRDPRRGYGWWHQTWVYWCGFTYYRDLWVDDQHLDPQFGAAVFCEERAAVTNIMMVIKNCLDPQSVRDITFNYTGKKKVDVEVYVLTNNPFIGVWWNYHDGIYDLMPGETFVVNAVNYKGETLPGGVLSERIMMRVRDAGTGKLLDTLYIRSSGEWFLEVEPGNFYGDFEILSSTIILGDGSEWDDWWGGECLWWDWFFGFWRWEEEEFRCGWVPEECYDADEAKAEQARICGNVTLLKQVINMLVQADDILARVAISDAENTTVENASYNDEYAYHLKWAKRYWARGNAAMKKGRAYNAITDFKRSWKHSVLAVKWAIKEPEDPEPSETVYDPCWCLDNEDCKDDYSYPWWMHWYIKYSNWGHLKKCVNPEIPCGGCGGC
jgi:hypothetical protein